MLKILSENLPFLGSVYSMNGVLFLVASLAAVDAVLRGWGMWRAARMEKKFWFIGLLFVNSLGILPIVFLLMTREEYARFLNARAPSVAAGTDV